AAAVRAEVRRGFAHRHIIEVLRGAGARACAALGRAVAREARRRAAPPAHAARAAGGEGSEGVERGCGRAGVEELGGAGMTQISVSGVAVEFGATTLLKDVTFTVAAGERWGI